MIFYEGNPPLAVYCIHSGKVKLYKTGEKGQRQLIRLLGPGDILGFRALLANEAYAASGEAIEPTTACLIPGPTMNRLLRELPEVAFALMAKLASELRVSEDQMLTLLHYSARQRTALLLISLTEGHSQQTSSGGLFKITSLRRSEMAQMIGVTPETMSRTLRDFAAQGLIELGPDSVTVINIAGLVKVSPKL